ncbi:branched-chain amino acid transport system substrate-binding protein [Anaerospora hongkongensis]|uniref:Branched-chain amino acid transport system substrate-binding protein n=2 Tax=Anaerospora hongkongensis TaxID=244830 RepID=A0A4R1Q1Z8_9FIRM|nr:ABC transporter substrate-binding protein [Anaerospora hongkongensis]TCL37668.1 branched-chain amino acid transport system substrate-binding protein [Anaerospora hongkongensis]
MMKRFAKTGYLLALLIGIAGLVAGCSDGAGKGDIKIGMVYELTGSTASYGTSAANGAKLAFKEVNAAGGVLGKQLQIITADNKGEPSESANAMTKVITQDRVVAVTGFTVSSCGIAGSVVAEDNKIPFVAAATVNPKVTMDERTGKVKNYTFRACFIDSFQGTVAANFAFTSLKAKNAAILIDNSSDYSKGLSAVFKEVFTAKGGQIAAEQAYLQKDQDFKSTLTAIKAQNPELIYIPGYYEDVGKIIKQARELGITVPILGGDAWDSPKLAELGGAQALNNTFFTNFYSVEDKNPVSNAFIEAYKKEYGQLPDSMAAMGYDAANLLVDAIKRANSTDSAKIREALAATKNFKSVSGDMALNENHDAVRGVVIMEMKDGKQVYRETIKQ